MPSEEDLTRAAPPNALEHSPESNSPDTSREKDDEGSMQNHAGDGKGAAPACFGTWSKFQATDLTRVNCVECEVELECQRKEEEDPAPPAIPKNIPDPKGFPAEGDSILNPAYVEQLEKELAEQKEACKLAQEAALISCAQNEGFKKELAAARALGDEMTREMAAFFQIFYNQGFPNVPVFAASFKKLHERWCKLGGDPAKEGEQK